MIEAWGLEFAGLIVAFSVSAILPGADFAMVLKQAIGHGRRTAILTSAGVATALLVHGAYTILGLGLVLSQSLLFFTVLKYVGAAYLVWLGISALRSPPPRPPADIAVPVADTMGAGRAFALGFLTNLLNPKAVLFFVALFTTLVGAATPLPVRAGYVGVMALELFLWFALVSVFFTTPAIRAGFYRLGRWFNFATGLTFIALAVRVAVARPS